MSGLRLSEAMQVPQPRLSVVHAPSLFANRRNDSGEWQLVLLGLRSALRAYEVKAVMTHDRGSATHLLSDVSRWFGDVQMGAQARRMVKRSDPRFVP
jgi:hypothetical protein